MIREAEPIPDLKWKGAFHYKDGYYYFRNVGNRILLGGGRHLAKEEETTESFGETFIIQNALSELLNQVILPKKNPNIAMKWSGIMGVGERKKPIVEEYLSKIWVAVRMGGMGVAIGNQIGEDVARRIIGEIN